MGRWGRQDFAAALLCVAVALLIRWRCADHSPTFDELWHLAVSTGRANDFVTWPKDAIVAAPTSLTSLESAAPLRSVWAPMRAVLHPPLFPITLRLWREFCGDSDWVAAMYSAVWSIVAIVFVFAAVRLQAGVGLAACVGLAMAVSPVQAHLGSEIRGYAMMMGLTAMAVWQMVRMDTSGPTSGRVWLLGLTLCPLVLTHYFAAGTCAAVCLWGVVRLRGPMLRHFMASVAAAAVCFAVVWLPQAVTQLKDLGSGDGFLKTDQPFWRNALVSGVAAPVRLFFYVSTRKISTPCSIALLAFTATGVWRRPSLLPWLLMLTMPIVTLLALDAARGTQHASFIRYSAAAAVAMPAAPVLAAAAIRPAAGWVLGLVFIMLAAAGLGAPRDIGSPAFHHVTRAFLPVLAQAPKETPLTVFMPPDGGKDWYANAMILEWSHVPGFFPRPTMRLCSPLPHQLRMLRDAAPGGQFWFLTAGQPTDGADVPAWLQTLLPDARPVQPPLSIPSGGAGIQPQPAAELWLLKLNPPVPDAP